MGNEIDGHIDQLVKAKWLAIGLSQADLFEVLYASRQTPPDCNGSSAMGADRMMRIAEALDHPCDLLGCSAAAAPDADIAQASNLSLLLSLLDLRMLRAFHRMRDDRTKLMLMHLAEQIVRRQANRGEPSDAS